MGLAAIKVDGLSKRYRLAHGKERRVYQTLRESLIDLVKAPLRRRQEVEEFWALKDVSFEVQPGEVVGIIGRNGAGKSTLLKILSRITKPTTGYAEINGRVGSLLEVGTGFHPELTGRENVFLNGSILGMTRSAIKLRFDEIVAFAEIEKFLDTPVKRYSSGMYVRLAFAVAAHLEPEILIVDEVLAVGDAAFQQKCLGKMGETAQGGRTILFVSHNMGAISALCRHGIVIEAGKLTFGGDVNDAITFYNAASAEHVGHKYGACSSDTTPHFTRIEASQEGVPGPPFRIDKEITIRFEFEAGEVSGLVVGTRVRNSLGVTVIHSTDEFAKPAESRNSTVRECILPPYALAEDVYYVRGGLFVRNRDVYQVLEDVISFRVDFFGHFADQTSGQHWFGVTGPGLVQWKSYQ